MIEIIDTTRLRDSVSCLRLYYWRHERGYIPIAPRLPLEYGRGVHASLAGHYSGLTAGQCLKMFEDIWKADVLPYQIETLAEDDPRRNPIRWAEVFMVYRQKFAVEPFKILQLDGKPAVEVPFFLPLSDEIALGGVLDLVVEWLGQIMLYDHKTTSYLNNKYFATFNPNHQAANYLLAANELMKPDRPINTMIFNCILTHPTELNPDKIFARQPTTRSPWQLAEQKEQMVGWWNIVREARRTGSWPMDDHFCTEWGGCVYHPLCTEVQANFRKLIPSKALFKVQVWNPLAELQRHGFKEVV